MRDGAAAASVSPERQLTGTAQSATAGAYCATRLLNRLAMPRPDMSRAVRTTSTSVEDGWGPGMSFASRDARQVAGQAIAASLLAKELLKVRGETPVAAAIWGSRA